MQNESENEKDKPGQPATEAADANQRKTNGAMARTKNAFLVAMAYEAKGDWDKILGYLTQKVPFSDREIEKAFARCDAKGLCPLAIGNDNYPEELKNIPHPPFVLFATGNLDLLKNDGRERLGIVVSDGMKKQHKIEAGARRAMAEKKPLIAYFTTDTAKTALEEELWKYCQSGNGLLITENLGAQKSRGFARARGTMLFEVLGIPNLQHFYPKQTHEKSSEEPEPEA